MRVPPSGDQILCGRRPSCIFELEAGLEQARGNNLATLEHQFRFRAQQEGAQFQHSLCGWKTDASAPSFPQNSEELAVGKWVGGGQVHGAREFLPGDEEFNRPNEVGLMNPRDKLSTRQGSSTETVTNERKKYIEYTALISTEGHGAAEGNLSGSGSLN